MMLKIGKDLEDMVLNCDPEMPLLSFHVTLKAMLFRIRKHLEIFQSIFKCFLILKSIAFSVTWKL